MLKEDCVRSSKRIMFVANTSWYLVNFRLPLLAHMVSIGWEVFAVAPADTYSNLLKKHGVKFVDLPFSRKGLSPYKETLLLLRMLRIYKRIEPDLIHHFTPKMVIYGSLVARFLGLRCVNSVTGLGYAFVRIGFLQRFVTVLYKVAFLGKSEVIFQNPDDRRMFISLGIINIKRTSLIMGSGVNAIAMSPSSTMAEKNDAVTFTLVSRMIWDKGVGVFVKAAKIVKEKYPSARFLLVGGPDAGNPNSVPWEFLEMQNSSGLIEWTGHTDDVKTMISNSDVIVLPTYYREGVPRSLIEGASMAKPLIATDTPGCREIVKHNRNGFLVPPKEVAPLAFAMLALAKNSKLRIQMGNNGRARVLKDFDVRIVIKRTMEVYRKTGISLESKE